MKTYILSLTTLTLLAVAFGCERQTHSATPSTPDAKPTAALTADMFLAAPPEGARDIGALKEDTAATGEVVVHGRIGGRREPFVAGTAVFLLTDMSLPTCDMGPGDKCPTPWDYCCEPKDKLAANTCTVQIVGADGKPLAIDVKGQHGLDPKAEIYVKGKIAERAEGVLVIDAAQIYVKPA